MKDWVVAEPLSDRPMRLRMAILEMTVDAQEVPAVTAEDVQRRWAHLADSGSTPYHIAVLANGPDIEPEMFKRYMALLNSRL